MFPETAISQSFIATPALPPIEPETLCPSSPKAPPLPAVLFCPPATGPVCPAGALTVGCPPCVLDAPDIPAPLPPVFPTVHPQPLS